jgi:Ca-activated chloride channel homolog
MRRLNSCVLIPILWACVLPAQEVQEAVFTSDINLVPMHLSVVDNKGRLVTNLPQTAFKVYEDGVEQAIRIFRREDVPISMGLVIDNSGSMRDKRSSVAAASLALVKASNPQDEVFIVNFNDVAYLDQDFTSDTKKLERALDKLNSRGGTAIFDAISLSIDNLKKKGKQEKKVLVVITDGNDNQSYMKLEQLVNKAQKSEVLIYAIGLLSEEDDHDAHEAKKALKQLTGNSGGLEYFPRDLQEIGKITPQIAQELRSQYVAAYVSTNAALDGSYRKVKVTVSGPGHPTVRTRAGYFAGTPATANMPGSGSK